MQKKWLVATAKTVLDAVKTSAENLVHKRAKEARELIKKIYEKFVKPKPFPEENSRNVEKIVIPP